MGKSEEGGSNLQGVCAPAFAPLPTRPKGPIGVHTFEDGTSAIFILLWLDKTESSQWSKMCFQCGDAIIARALGRLRAREREWAWWNPGMSQTPHIPRTLQLIRVVPNEQRYKCANCANCAAVSKSDSASVVIAVRDCCCSNPSLLCLLLFFKITKSLHPCLGSKFR